VLSFEIKNKPIHMNKPVAIILSILLMAGFSCKKSQTATTTLNVTVTDGSTGSPAAGASVFLFDSSTAVTSNMPKYSATTDQNGKVSITIAFLSQYFVIAQKAGEKNYYSGLIPVGIFKTQTDIQDSPAQTPPGVIGGVKFQDTNGDGAITVADDAPAPSASIVANTANSFSATIY
jgi:hypothetical protein